MLDKYTCLQKLAALRRDEIIVTTMSLAAPWAELSDGPLDFAHVESAMGHALSFSYGLALAHPERQTIVLNGDGSTLMSLGALVTVAQRPVPNLTIVVAVNHTYEVTGNQYIPGAGICDFEAMAHGAGIGQVYTIYDGDQFDDLLPLHLAGQAMRVFIWRLNRTAEPVPKPSRPIRERAHRLRQALIGTE